MQHPFCKPAVDLPYAGVTVGSDVLGQTVFHMLTRERRAIGQIRRDWTRQVSASLQPIIDLRVCRHGNRNFAAVI